MDIQQYSQYKYRAHRTQQYVPVMGIGTGGTEKRVRLGFVGSPHWAVKMRQMRAREGRERGRGRGRVRGCPCPALSTTAVLVHYDSSRTCSMAARAVWYVAMQHCLQRRYSTVGPIGRNRQPRPNQGAKTTAPTLPSVPYFPPPHDKNRTKIRPLCGESTIHAYIQNSLP